MVTSKTRREKRKHAIVFMSDQSRCDRGPWGKARKRPLLVESAVSIWCQPLPVCPRQTDILDIRCKFDFGVPRRRSMPSATGKSVTPAQRLFLAFAEAIGN